MLFKLTLSGMKGRKKESLLLGFVIFLSVLFIVMAMVLHTSNEAAKQRERMATFGPWENGYFQIDEQEADGLYRSKEIKSIGESNLVGYDPSMGLIGSYNSDYEALTTIQMVEGHMPKAKNEIAIEHNVLASYPDDIKIGDVISVPITIKLHSIPYQEYYAHQTRRIMDELKEAASLVKVANKDLPYEDLVDKYDLDLAQYALDPEFLEKDLKTLEDYIEYLQDDDREMNASQDYIDFFRKYSYQRYVRYILDTEYYDDYTLNLKTYYNYHFIKQVNRILQDYNGESLVSEDDLLTTKGILTDIELIFTTPLTITGFYDNHNKYWDIGEGQVPRAYIDQGLYESIKTTADDNNLTDIHQYMPLKHSNFSKSNVFIKSKSQPWRYYNQNKDGNQNLRVNSYAYPEASFASQATVTYGILFMIFIATAIAIFQINLSQIKRRSKKLTLLKAIGMVKGQMVKLLCYEMLILIGLAFPLAVLSGLGLVYILIELLNSFASIALIYTVEMTLIFMGLIISLVSVMIGMSFPMVKALKTPLTGAMNSAPRDKKKMIRRSHDNHKLKILNFKRLSWTYLIYEKRKNIISITLYSISITILLASLFLAFLSFNRYKDEVIAVDRPDYSMDMIRGLSNNEIQELEDALDSVEEIENYQIIKYGLGGRLYHESFMTHPVFRKEFDNKTLVSAQEAGEKEATFINESIETKIYALEAESYMWQALTEHMNPFDLQKFNNGEGVLILLPQFAQETSVKTSYDFRDQATYLSQYDISPGNTLTLGLKIEPKSKSSFGDVQPHSHHELEVLALSHHMSDFGVWPFSETLEAPVVITSIENFNNLYPRSKYRLRMYYHRFKVLTETQFPTAYGKTYVYIHTKEGAYSPKYQVELQRIGLTYNTPLTFLMAEKESIFQQSLKLATIIMTLGLSIALVILMILFNTSQSKVENERKRIGILQAIGITNKQFKRQYLLTGLSFGLIALIIGHLVLGFALVIMGIIAGGPLLLAIENILWLYPIGIHVAICISYLLLSVITYYLPLGKILVNQPIYNINSNQR